MSCSSRSVYGRIVWSAQVGDVGCRRCAARACGRRAAERRRTRCSPRRSARLADVAPRRHRERAGVERDARRACWSSSSGSPPSGARERTRVCAGGQFSSGQIGEVMPMSPMNAPAFCCSTVGTLAFQPKRPSARLAAARVADAVGAARRCRRRRRRRGRRAPTIVASGTASSRPTPNTAGRDARADHGRRAGAGRTRGRRSRSAARRACTACRRRSAPGALGGGDPDARPRRARRGSRGPGAGRRRRVGTGRRRVAGTLSRSSRPARRGRSGRSAGAPRPSLKWHDEHDWALKVGPRPSRPVVDAGAVTQLSLKKLLPTANARRSLARRASVLGERERDPGRVDDGARRRPAARAVARGDASGSLARSRRRRRATAEQRRRRRGRRRNARRSATRG